MERALSRDSLNERSLDCSCNRLDFIGISVRHDFEGLQIAGRLGMD